MRFATYYTDLGPQLGVVNGEMVYAVPGHDMLSLIAAGEAGQAVAAEATKTGPGLALSGLSLLAPIPVLRRNVFCVGLNYFAHGQEGAAARGQTFTPPERPLFFTKATTALNGPYGEIPFDDSVSVQIDWEVELAFVIGRSGKNIRAAEAMDYVFGYTVVNDVSARDLQTSHGGQFFKGKSLDGTCPMGPWIVTRDEIADPNALPVRCRVNGVTKQDSTTAEFIFKIPDLIEWLSRGLTLLPGDVVATGTPAGVGFARTPPEFLKPGDVVECEVGGIGTIRNSVMAVS
jgi:2-keto-4-pentenoate hydratase/2-oxohepta-3-ene-1,7-dioic acid hydratase in catechol pathway